MKTIYKKLLFLLLFLPFSVLAQGILEGTIVDSKSNQPIPGVNLVIAGSNTGTQTDFDGKFSYSDLVKIELEKSPLTEFGIMISPKFTASYGLLGTTFGGSHLACAAGIAVLEVLEKEKLMDNVNNVYAYFLEAIKQVPEVIKVKGKGLMLGVEFDFDVSTLRKKMIIDKHIFTGNANNKNLLRILPPLTIKKEAIDQFIIALKEALAELK